MVCDDGRFVAQRKMLLSIGPVILYSVAKRYSELVEYVYSVHTSGVLIKIDEGKHKECN